MVTLVFHLLCQELVILGLISRSATSSLKLKDVFLNYIVSIIVLVSLVRHNLLLLRLIVEIIDEVQRFRVVFIFWSLRLIYILVPFIGLSQSLTLILMSRCDLRYLVHSHILIKEFNLADLLLRLLWLLSVLIWAVIVLIQH
jgi:hypothetical protein